MNTTKENLKILVLATTFPRWKDDTTPKFVANLSKEIQENDNDIIVLSPQHPDSKAREVMSGMKIYRYPYFYPKKYQKLREGSTVEKVRQSHLVKLQIPLMMISLFIHTIWLWRKEDIDVIHSHWILPNGIIGSVMNHLFQVPHVMTIHAGGVLMLRKIPFSSSFATYTFKYADGIAPVSEYIKDTYMDLVDTDAITSSKKVLVQPMGTYTEVFDDFSRQSIRSEKDLDDKILGLFVGRLAKKKGIEYLLRAINLLEEERKDLQVIIVGTGPLKEELRSWVRERDLEDDVEFTDWISEEDLNELYVCADFVIVPSIETESGDTEGMPTVIAEAFASGNPVIATDVGGISDVVEDGQNGYIVPEKRPDELAKKIALLINGKHLREELSTEALDTAQKLDWEHCGTVYTQLLRSAYASSERVVT